MQFDCAGRFIVLAGKDSLRKTTALSKLPLHCWRSSMKLVSTRRRCGATMYVLASLIVALFSNQAQAVNEYFDVNGTGLGSGATTAGPFTWEGSNWNTDSTGVVAPAAWSDAGNFPIFAAGSDAAATNYTVNVGSNHTIAGMALATNGGGTVVVASTGGTLNLFSNVAGQGIFVG